VLNRAFLAFGSLFCVLMCALDSNAQINMPDPTQIAGMAIPAPELPDGTVSVRLIREQLGNNIAGHPVEVKAGEVRRAAKTDENGRAQITGLPAGASAIAGTVVDGETLLSKPFDVPARGGVRVILIAGLARVQARREKEAKEAAESPPTRGIVVFGGDTRVILEFQDDALQVFYLLDIVNTARTRVDPGGPLIIDLPTGVGGATILQGSSPSATARGDRVTITSPFAPGTTSVQIGYRLPHSSTSMTLTQKWPATLEKISVLAEKVGDLKMTSQQFTSQGDMRANDGTPFTWGTGGALPAGGTLAVELAGLPVHTRWPRNAALLLASLLIATGVWMAAGTGSRAGEDRRRLTARREKLFGELVKLEQQQRAGRVDQARYVSKRQQLMTELERIYGELDTAA
jgi:hypothetical protein